MSCCRETNDLNKVLNYLLLGDEGNFYQAGKRSVNFGQRLSFVEKLIRDGRGVDVVKVISETRVEGDEFQELRIYALVHCARCDHLETKRAAYEALGSVCTTARHLLMYVYFSEQVGADKRSSGWGRAQRKAVAKWYNDKPALELASTCARFTNYHGWTHRDVLRLAHVKPKNKCTSVMLTYLTKGLDAVLKLFDNEEEEKNCLLLKYLRSIQSLQQTKDEKEAAFLIEQHQLHLEMVPTNMRKSTEVWRSLLPTFPLSKLVFHIRRFAQLGFINPNNPVYPILLDQLKDHSRLSPTDLHPVDIFLALKKYEDLGRATSAAPRSHQVGVGVANTFRPPKRRLNTAVVDALHNMFTASLQKCAVPVGKRILVTVDVRNPMVHSKVQGCPQMTPALASAILILSLLNSDEGITITAFSSNDIKVLELTKDMSLLEIAKRMRETPMGPVNCAKPITWANQNKKSYDAFLVLTDNQVKAPADGKLGDHLSQYRSALNISNARLFVCCLAARRMTTALPEQNGVIEIGGFDAHVPRILNHFIRASIC